jgi:glutamate synthase (ferredoxin)
MAREGVTLPEPGSYGVGIAFLPPDPDDRRRCEETVERIVAEEGQTLLGWRDVPTCNESLGGWAKANEPVMRQLFIGRSAELDDPMDFERKLYVISSRAHHTLRHGEGTFGDSFYLASLSWRTLVYKGMLTPEQVGAYFADLRDPRLESAIVLTHSRFSTNTFPSWERAHPYRYLIHNGEINTLRGNVNWMNTREGLLESELFGDDLEKLFPIVEPDASDSGMLDNCLEFLHLAGRSLPHALMMMIPQAWEKDADMSPELRAFYQFHSCLMEPWDGPASVAFTDGTLVGATLDRNGLRPSRYYVTRDDRIIMGSEVGCLDVDPADVLHKGRLQPGRMLLVDTDQGRIVSDEELKAEMASQHPYQEWLDRHFVEFDDLPDVRVPVEKRPHGQVVQRLQAFGYTFEELRMILGPMAERAFWPIASMGTDTPLAVLSDRPKPLYDYFKQLFAQVTNPPIDPIREELVTSTELSLGSERNLLHPTPDSCEQLRLENPVITNAELERLKLAHKSGFEWATLPILFEAERGEAGLEEALEGLFRAADDAIDDGAHILILSDRGVDRRMAPIPALLAVAGLHHHLVRRGRRTRVGIVLESGDPREVHHFCCLLGYGATAINPYMVYEAFADMIDEGMLPDLDYETAVANYNKGVVKGVVKVMSKMGICTLQSYHGAQIFEAIGLTRAVVDRYFTGTDSRIEGIGLDVLAEEARLRHRSAFPDYDAGPRTLDEGGEYQWRKDGEFHAFNPEAVHLLQRAVRTGSYEDYRAYADQVDAATLRPTALRGLLDFDDAREPVPVEEVEPEEALLARFKTGAMSYGSISKEAHEALAIAMNRVGGKSNSGEGGEDAARYTPDPNGDSRSSAIKQVASGRFGVTSEYLSSAAEIQIKMAQGAKPGEGGELPGKKVYPWIARVRQSTPGVGLISPPPHHDIYSIEDLAELIHDLKNANPSARINVKLVSEVGVGTVAAGVAKGHADVVLVSGYDGGTGASPQTSIKHAGLPWELGLAETHQTLVLNRLRDRITVEVDGQLKTGRDLAVAALLGAEEFGFGTTALMALGCIMMRVCHLDTCPVGVATQNPELRKKFPGRPEYVENYLRFIARDLREHMARLGFRTLNEMVGRTDVLRQRAVDHWKAKGVELSALLVQPDVGPEVRRHCCVSQDHGLDRSLDRTTLLEICRPALEHGERVRAELPVTNTNRVVGTLVGHEVTRRYGAPGLPDDTIHLTFRGSAGQSFGAWVPHGMTLRLQGDANDYFGKGLSGGTLVLHPPDASPFVPREEIIVGNVALYGATSGEAYIRGMAGERFCVRNSGARAVVEAVGDHGCEYMTGGRVVVLGPTGRNFAAGMSGGIAWVFDEDGRFTASCNTELCELERPREAEEMEEAREMVERHVALTGSELGRDLLADWENVFPRFVRVMPRDYKRVVEAIQAARNRGMNQSEAAMAAFNANKREMARASGN